MKPLLKMSFSILITLCALVAESQILIGQSTGLTGSSSANVAETSAGAALYLKDVNSKGGIYGQKIELLALDDKSDVKLTVENTRQLIEDKKVIAMFLTRGTPQTEAIIGLLDKYKVPLIAPSTGAMVLHRPVQKHIFNVRATYQREAEKAIAHLGTLGIKRIAIIQTNDSFGADGTTGTVNGLSALGLSAVANEKIDRLNPDFSKIMPKIIASNPQAIIIIAASQNVATGVKAIRAAGSNAQIVTLSNNASYGFVQSLGQYASGVIVSQVFPNERSITYAFVKEAQDLIKSSDVKSALSPAMLEGVAAAKVLVEALRRAGVNPTREKLQTALENFKKYDLGGLEISFGLDDHTGLDFSDLSIIGTDGKFKR
jgi:branched-chain amino acid transport system substrate-binding protein